MRILPSGNSPHWALLGALTLVTLSLPCAHAKPEQGVIPRLVAAPAATPTEAPGIAPGNDPNLFVSLAKKVVPSVVNISTLSRVKSPFPPGSPEELFRRFFEDFFGGRGMPPGMPPEGNDDEGGGEGGRAPRAMALGSGFIIDASGVILTNNHVVAEADEIKIHFTEAPDERPSDGEVIGRDPDLDVALIRVKSKRKMVPLPLGDSEKLEVGEYVMAVGNPFGQGHSVTHGIISAKGRIAPDLPLLNYLQTDAPINPGNSGGPLVNLQGEVIGINNAIEARAQGIGFAIPSHSVKAVLPQLKEKGTVSRGYIGLLVEPLRPEIAEGVGAGKHTGAPFVTHVYPGDPAARAGIKPYDVIILFDKKPLKTATDLVAAVTATPPGARVPIKVLRAGKEVALTLEIEKRPAQKDLRGSERGQKAPPKKSKGGLSLQDLTPEVADRLGLDSAKDRGVVVVAVEQGSAADRAGLLQGDLIVEVDQKPISDVKAYESLVKAKGSYLLRIRRKDPSGLDAYTVIVLSLKESKS
ncbi:MAG: trypsin-like peptidase domain-containing protein [Oligoflexia bacterium]|nr:trypsin-like peptidase domain-containing protein [Oligoflexia bacterium]